MNTNQPAQLDLEWEEWVANTPPVPYEIDLLTADVNAVKSHYAALSNRVAKLEAYLKEVK